MPCSAFKSFGIALLRQYATIWGSALVLETWWIPAPLLPARWWMRVKRVA
jgi:hypothetical protein